MPSDPPPDNHLPEYLRGYSHADGERHFQAYFLVLQRWGTPAELDRLVRRVGSPDQAGRLLDELLARVETWEWNRRLGVFLKRVALAFVTLVGALATAKMVLPPDLWPW